LKNWLKPKPLIEQCSFDELTKAVKVNGWLFYLSVVVFLMLGAVGSAYCYSIDPVLSLMGAVFVCGVFCVLSYVGVVHCRIVWLLKFYFEEGK